MIDAKIQGIDDLFDDSVSYRIPQFQRPYAWSEKQWEPLWEDAREMADRILKHGQEDLLPHFMGSILLQPIKSADAKVSQIFVVDGQQRLTTLQLLIKATQKAFQASPITNTGKFKNLNNLLLNDQKRIGNDPDNETKIRQSNEIDKAVFKAIIKGKINPALQNYDITKAYNYFHENVLEWVTSDANADVRAMALYDALVKQLKVVSIILAPRQEPYVIFETLNARGKPLTQADLIKGTIIHKGNAIDDEQKAEELFGKFEDIWWHCLDEQGKDSQIRLDRFLNYWIMMRISKYVTFDRTAEEFRNYIQFQPNIEEVAEDIKGSGSAYWKIEKNKLPGKIKEDKPPGKRIALFLERIKTMKIGVIMPPLLWLYTNDVSEDEWQRIARALESYLVRRMLCKIYGTGLKNLFTDMAKPLEAQKSQPADKVIIQFLNKKFGGNRWPDDDEVISYLTNYPMPGSKAQKMMVFEAIATSKPMSAKPLGDTSELTVERILPQGGFAVNPNGNLDGFVDFIGNLTLASKGLNFAIPNKSWENKKKALHQHSRLYLNKELLENDPEVWDETAIEERSKQLARRIVEIWTHADGI